MLGIKQNIESWIIRILFLSFFIPIHFQTILFLLFGSYSIIKAVISKVRLSNKELIVALILGGSYLFYIAYIPLTDSHDRSILYSLLERKAGLFVLPFLIPIYLKLSNINFKEELKWFVYGNVLFGLLVNCIVFFQQLYKPSIDVINHVNYRILFESIGGIHPTYFGIYCCFSLSILLFESNLNFKSIRFVVLFSLLTLSLLLVAPKISLLIFAGTILYFILFILKKSHKVKLSIIGILILCFGLSVMILPFLQQRLLELISGLSSDQSSALENSVRFRQLILQIDFNLLKENCLLGIGPVQLQHQLDMAYAHAAALSHIKINSYNTHNEYFNHWISFGLLGFVYFIFVFGFQLKQALQLKSNLYFFLMLNIIITCLTENILSRQHGILFVAFFTALFYYSKTNYQNVRSNIKIQ
jgi:O-antigen ligase